MSRFATLFLLAAVAAAISMLASCAPVQQIQNAAAAGSAILSNATVPRLHTSLGPAELRLLQSREFSTTKAIAYASVMHVLLDSGYRVLSADLTSGLITAAASTNSRLRLDPAGIARTNQTPLASVFIDQRSAQSVHIRINFSVGRIASGQLAEQGESAVLDQALYSAFFNQISLEVAQRTDLAGSPPAIPEHADAYPTPGGALVKPIMGTLPVAPTDDELDNGEVNTGDLMALDLEQAYSDED